MQYMFLFLGKKLYKVTYFFIMVSPNPQNGTADIPDNYPERDDYA